MSERVKKEIFSTQILQIIDAFFVWAAFMLADWLRDPLREFLSLDAVREDGLSKMIWVVYTLIPLTPLVLDHCRFYRDLRRRSVWISSRRLLRGLFIAGVIVGMLTVFAKIGELSRLILGVGFVISYILIFARDQLVSKILKIRGNDDRNLEHVVIAGGEEEIDEFLLQLSSDEAELMRVVGRIDLSRGSQQQLAFRQLINETAAQRVILLTGRVDFRLIAEAVEVCETQGVEAWVGAFLLPTQIAKLGFDTAGDKPMLVFRSTPDFTWQVAAKQVLDRVGAFLILLISSPLWVFAYIGIRISSPEAPVIFKQERSGLFGRKFQIWKFRTMIPNAEQKLQEIKDEVGNEMEGPTFKLQKDPRIFPFGAFLRKYSIDELPQLVNVVCGEMSLVGPRPLPVHETEAISDSAHRRRLSMKPGITCIWQISGRSNITDFQDWVSLDTEYIDNWSLGLDLKILLQTIPAVLFGKGAR